MKFSIITPSFGQLKWLERAVASVADQTGIDGIQVEHLVQDAGTAGIEILGQSRSAPGNYQLRLFMEKDEGMYDAINRGLKKSSGDIYAWLNCDEQYLPGVLARVADYFEKHPQIDVIFGDALLVDAQGKALSYRRAVLPGAVHTRLVHLNTLSCATFFRKSVVEKGFLFETRWKMIGDAVWVHDMLKAEVTMGVLPEILATFAFTGVNQSASSQANEESDSWRHAADAPSPVLRLPSILWHRLHKWRGGAYKKRHVEYEIFDQGIDRRSKFQADGLGWTWPTVPKSGLG